MRKILNITFAVLSLLTIHPAFAATHWLDNCDQLKTPKTILLVHAPWCTHCDNFLPVYESVSDLPSMSQYTFYTKELDVENAVCGVNIDGFPQTFAKNMSVNLLGEVSVAQLIDFIKNKA